MDIFGQIKTAVKIKPLSRDNKVFELHYRVTFWSLFAAAILVASKQHFGDPIDCITRDDVPNKIMDTYCWIHSTFTLPLSCNRTVGTQVAHPCVENYSPTETETRVYHKYYQWVYFVLVFQALAFYTPHWLWKYVNTMAKLTPSDKFKSPMANAQELEIMDSIVRQVLRAKHDRMNLMYIFALLETVNFLNVVCQMYVVDAFLGGTFTTYGLDVLYYLQMEQEERYDPMVRVFPKMTKCTFHRYGSSGDVQRHDALCILPLNIINEKIYIVMWFWFVLLAIISGLWLIYRLLTIFNGDFRLWIMKKRLFVDDKLLTDIMNWQHPDGSRPFDAGDWLLFMFMHRNMNGLKLAKFMQKLKEALKKEASQMNLDLKKDSKRPKNYTRANDETLQMLPEEPSDAETSDDDDEEQSSESEQSETSSGSSDRLSRPLSIKSAEARALREASEAARRKPSDDKQRRVG